MRPSAGLSSAASRTVAAPQKIAAPKKSLLTKLSEYARRVAGVLGIAAGAGIAASVPAPAQAYPHKTTASAPAPTSPVPGNSARPVATELRDREWKTVVEKGIGAKAFAQKFGTDDWSLLVDEEGNRLSDPSKLRQGRRYLAAKSAQDAEVVSAAVKSMGGMNLSPKRAEVRGHAKTSGVPAVEKVSADDIVSYAEEHLGKPYRLGANGVKSIDCSQLVVETLKKAGIVGSNYDITAAGLHDLSAAKKLQDVKKGDLVFLHKRSGHVGHVAIALGAPDEKGYIDIIDASSSQGGVTKRRFHTSLAGLSAGSLPFVGRTAPDAVPTYASAPKPSVTVAQAARAEEPSVSKVAKPVGKPASAIAKSQPVPVAAKPVAKPVRSEPIRAAFAEALDFDVSEVRTVERQPEVSRFVEKTASAQVLDFPSERVSSVPAVSKKVEDRVNATVVQLASRVSDRDKAESIRTSLEKKSLIEQIEYFRTQASNDPSYALAATKLEIVKLHGERSLVADNIAHYKAQAAKSVPGAFETLSKLTKVASTLDARIAAMKMAVNDAEYQKKKAA